MSELDNYLPPAGQPRRLFELGAVVIALALAGLFCGSLTLALCVNLFKLLTGV